jgi:hypothetical protein
MCFMAGANAVFTGEQMLTTPCKPPRSGLSRLLTFPLCFRPNLGSPWDEVRRASGVSRVLIERLIGQGYDGTVGSARHAEL